jgi:hypothetical protein
VLIVLLLLLLLLTLIIFSKLTILVNYFHHNDNDDLKIEFKLWFGLIKYKINAPLIKIDDNSPSVIVKSNSQMGSSSTKEKNTEHNVTQVGKKDILTSLKKTKELLEQIVHLQVIARKFLKKITVKQIEWHSMIGVGDAAHTGTMTGALWALKGGMIGIVSHYFILKEMPNITVTPHFQLAIIQTRFSCIFQFRIGHAILAGFKLMKFWKGGHSHFKTNTNFSKEKNKTV